MSYGATGLTTSGMSIRRKAKMSLIKMAIKIVILVAFMFWLMPNYIAPQVLGITNEIYAEYIFVLNIAAGVFAYPFMWMSDKLVEYQMGR